MQITQIVASLEARHGGPSRSVRGLAAGLADAGHAVELLHTVPASEPPALDSGLPALDYAFPRQWPQSFACSAPLRHHLFGAPTGIIHHHGLWLRTLAYAHRAAARKSVPLVISPRGMMSPWAWNHHRLKKLAASRLIHPGALAAASGWHATSEAEAADIRRLGFNQPVCVTPNGVEPPVPAAEVDASARWRAAVPALAGRRVALFYSRLHSKKRVVELIDLWLSAPRGDWLLLIAGIPEEYTIAELDAYVSRQRGGPDHIVVREGTDFPAPYAIASLFLLPSHSENFGLVVAEALVRGLPVLATDTTPWQKLDALGAGRCVPWGNYGRALDSLLRETPENLAARGRHGAAWAGEEFSWAKTAATLAAFYESLCLSHPAK